MRSLDFILKSAQNTLIAQRSKKRVLYPSTERYHHTGTHDRHRCTLNTEWLDSQLVCFLWTLRKTLFEGKSENNIESTMRTDVSLSRLCGFLFSLFSCSLGGSTFIRVVVQRSLPLFHTQLLIDSFSMPETKSERFKCLSIFFPSSCVFGRDQNVNIFFLCKMPQLWNNFSLWLFLCELTSCPLIALYGRDTLHLRYLPQIHMFNGPVVQSYSTRMAAMFGENSYFIDSPTEKIPPTRGISEKHTPHQTTTRWWAVDADERRERMNITFFSAFFLFSKFHSCTNRKNNISTKTQLLLFFVSTPQYSSTEKGYYRPRPRVRERRYTAAGRRLKWKN